jgi:hypothetical protein
MMPDPGTIGKALIAVVAMVRGASATGRVALLAVAGSLSHLLHIGAVKDIERMRALEFAKEEAKLEDKRADIRVKNATAMKTVAEAAEIASRVIQVPNDGQQNYAASVLRLHDALSTLAQYGGGVHLDSAELRALLGPPSPTLDGPRRIEFNHEPAVEDEAGPPSGAPP